MPIADILDKGPSARLAGGSTVLTMDVNGNQPIPFSLFLLAAHSRIRPPCCLLSRCGDSRQVEANGDGLGRTYTCRRLVERQCAPKKTSC